MAKHAIMMPNRNSDQTGDALECAIPTPRMREKPQVVLSVPEFLVVIAWAMRFRQSSESDAGGVTLATTKNRSDVHQTVLAR